MAFFRRFRLEKAVGAGFFVEICVAAARDECPSPLKSNRLLCFQRDNFCHRKIT
jgi:hypothetical protein